MESLANNMIKHAIIIHGWGGNNAEKQLVWLKDELIKCGIKVSLPLMPNSDTPKIEEWINTITTLIDESDKTILIGHSMGCQAILRYLEKAKKQKFAEIVLIAPWLNVKRNVLNEEEIKIVEVWEKNKINFKKIKTKSNSFEIFYSTNDPYVLVDDSLVLKRELEAKTHNLGNLGHIDESSGITRMPFVMEVIEKKSLI